MSWDLLGGKLNIVHIIDVILRHVKDSKRIRDVLEEAATRAERIQKNIRHLGQLEKFDGPHTDCITHTVEDFEKIYGKLTAIQEKVTNRAVARTFLTSPETLAELKEIELQLAHKEHNVQILAMVGCLLVKHNSREETIDRISEDLEELKFRSVDDQPTANLLRYVCQKYFEACRVLETSDRSDWRWLEEMNPGDKLATGISFYEGNRCTMKDFPKAARYLNAALKAGRWEANYYLGMMYRYGRGVEKSNVRAVELFEQGTRTGDSAAMAQLGQCYMFGAGVRMSLGLGVAYIEMGAERGDPVALSIRSWQKLYGIHTERNASLAFQLCKESVKKGNERAKMHLATCYIRGIGVERDPVKAVQLWTESIEAGGFSCITDLARCYEEGDGVDVDLSKAAGLYKRDSEVCAKTWRRAFVQPNYGLCLLRGRGVPQDKKKGWEEIQSSVQAGRGAGWFIQGECYRHGYGVNRNIKKAVKSYEQAIKTENESDGKPRAHFALGCLYEIGDGVPRDLNKAFTHFIFGADRYYRDSQWKVAIFCETGADVQQDTVRAVDYFRLAANNGHREAQLKAFKYYMKGKGIQKNLMTAAQIIRLAAENGDREAQRLLPRLEKRQRCRSKQSKSLPPRLGRPPPMLLAAAAWYARRLQR